MFTPTENSNDTTRRHSLVDVAGKAGRLFLITGAKSNIQPIESNVRLGARLAKSELPTLSEVKQQYIEKVVSHFSGNKSKAAKVLGIDRASLWRKLKQYNQKHSPQSSKAFFCNEAKTEE